MQVIDFIVNIYFRLDERWAVEAGCVSALLWRNSLATCESQVVERVAHITGVILSDLSRRAEAIQTAFSITVEAAVISSSCSQVEVW